ncbi:hypothetical protein EB815_04560 [Mesorhizobium loti]|uniref:Uncharacterized protein n=2 Tax=Phyllobacteriaceae TaxID=69277 RepID=A0A6M7TTY4_RHILI|nr:hypothetical protein ASE05_18295 [Mesorhizobium sp. Root172]OBQ65350.1 hypothetical protein A8145_14290 [Mesorhizobium loti]QKC68469.1 hypothetical protein EB815_04560 [Mesorhizobium loti]
MTLTFIVDPSDGCQTALRAGGDMPDEAPGEVLADSRPVGRRPLLGRLPWRLASLLLAPLRKGRRRLPPQDDYLRRDIGLPELEELPRYWDFTRSDH